MVRPAVEEHVAPRVALRRATRNRAKMLLRIDRALADGDQERAKGLQRRLLSSFSAKLCAVAEVNLKLKSAERARSRELVAIASQISAYRETEEDAHAIALPKQSNAWRCVTIFGLRRAALQSLVCTAIRPFHKPDPRQFAITGGGHNEAARHIRQAVADGYTWFVGLDITSFYNSIERRALTDIVPAPLGVIEHVIGPPPAEAICIRKVGMALSGIRLAEASQSGISQGSRSSPLIAEIVVKRLLTQFPLDVRIVNVADDFAIMARSKRDADAVTLALTRAAARSPAGRFQLRPKAHDRARRACDGFEFVGYRFRKRRSSVQVEPSDGNLTKFNSRVYEIAVEMERGRPDAATALRRYVINWWRAFPLCNAHLAEQDYSWARHHVREVIRHNRPRLGPLVQMAMEWEGHTFAPLPHRDERTELARAIRRAHPAHRSRVPHWTST